MSIPVVAPPVRYGFGPVRAGKVVPATRDSSRSAPLGNSDQVYSGSNPEGLLLPRHVQPVRSQLWAQWDSNLRPSDRESPPVNIILSPPKAIRHDLRWSRSSTPRWMRASSACITPRSTRSRPAATARGGGTCSGIYAARERTSWPPAPRTGWFTRWQAATPRTKPTSCAAFCISSRCRLRGTPSWKHVRLLRGCRNGAGTLSMASWCASRIRWVFG